MRKILEERLENAKLDYRYHLTGLGNDGFVDTNVYKIEGQIEAYQDCLNLIPTPRTEQEILKGFEALGYMVINEPMLCVLIKNLKEKIHISKYDKDYCKYDWQTKQPLYLTMQEHKLLNELFEVWQWV